MFGIFPPNTSQGLSKTYEFLPTIGVSLPSLLTRARELPNSQALATPGSGSARTAKPSGCRRPWLSSAPELQLPAGFVSRHCPLSAQPAGRGQVAAGQGPMGAGSGGKGGGEEEGGGLWAAAPFIAAAGRAGVLCFRSYGGANSCYQQAPGRLQHCGRRYHPVASDRRGGNAGERQGRRLPRPEPGARAWSGLRERTLLGQALRPVAGGRCLGAPGFPGLCRVCCPGLRCIRAGNRGLAGRRGAEPAQRAWRVPGAGWGKDGRSGGTGVRGDGARFSPQAAASKGTWGSRRARGAHWLVVGRLAPTWLVSERLGVLFPSLPCSGAVESVLEPRGGG